MARKDENDDVVVFPTIHRFNGNAKKFMRLVNSESTIKAYEKLLKEMGCKPSEFGGELRRRAWRGKSLRDIAAEVERD